MRRLIVLTLVFLTFSTASFASENDLLEELFTGTWHGLKMTLNDGPWILETALRDRVPIMSIQEHSEDDNVFRLVFYFIRGNAFITLDFHFIDINKGTFWLDLVNTGGIGFTMFDTGPEKVYYKYEEWMTTVPNPNRPETFPDRQRDNR